MKPHFTWSHYKAQWKCTALGVTGWGVDVAEAYENMLRALAIAWELPDV